METTRTTASSGPQEPEEELEKEAESHFFWEFLEFAKNRCWKKKILSAVIALTSLYILVDLIFLGNVQRFINNFLGWMTNHPALAVFAFILFLILASLLFIPPVVLIFGAGFAFADLCGFWTGSLVAILLCFFGLCIGSTLSFLRSRYMMQDLVKLFAERYPIVKAANTAMKTQGFKIMFLMRLCPIIPFNGLNHIGGITSISLKDFTGAFIGFLPTIIFWVFIGSSADNLAEQKADNSGEIALEISMLVFGIVFGVVALVIIFIYADKELQRSIDMDHAESWFRFKKPSTGDATQDTTVTDRDGIPSVIGGFSHDDEIIVLDVGPNPHYVAGAHYDDPEDPEVIFLGTRKQYPSFVLAAIGLNQRGRAVAPKPDEPVRHDENWLWLFA